MGQEHPFIDLSIMITIQFKPHRDDNCIPENYFIDSEALIVSDQRKILKFLKILSIFLPFGHGCFCFFFNVYTSVHIYLTNTADTSKIQWKSQKQQVFVKILNFLHYSFLPLKFTTPTAVEANLRGYTGATTIKLEACQETGQNRFIKTNWQHGEKLKKKKRLLNQN